MITVRSSTSTSEPKYLRSRLPSSSVNSHLGNTTSTEMANGVPGSTSTSNWLSENQPPPLQALSSPHTN
ncbi:hypothetical protein KSP39_PZI002261 [Platanthera zijinensis]|uniref:Uncharacterized protein n=1 Tax=Platanthera zijinensis TaxID=2320716 RepID=A0AAP0GDP2_9ASPA